VGEQVDDCDVTGWPSGTNWAGAPSDCFGEELSFESAASLNEESLVDGLGTDPHRHIIRELDTQPV
jgi:hypothetical protein